MKGFQGGQTWKVCGAGDASDNETYVRAVKLFPEKILFVTAPRLFLVGLQGFGRGDGMLDRICYAIA